MKIYSTIGYGQGTLFVTPGVDHPAVEDFHHRVLGEDGGTLRVALQIAVKFNNCEAEVSEDLGRYLVKRGQASTRPPLSRPKTPQERDMEKLGAQGDGRIVYSKPIEVGRRLPDPRVIDVPEHGLA